MVYSFPAETELWPLFRAGTTNISGEEMPSNKRVAVRITHNWFLLLSFRRCP